MKYAVWTLLLTASAFAAQGLRFEVRDAKGKEASAVTLNADNPDEDGWRQVRIAKAKGDPVLVWPFDGLAKPADGPEPIPAIVIQKGDERALRNNAVAASLATRILTGDATLSDVAAESGFSSNALTAAFSSLGSSADPWEKGVGLLYAGKPGEAAEQFAVALKQRQRQLTRVPSEIYPIALLYGQALFGANKFDAAAVALLTALQQRKNSAPAAKLRADALIKAGKAEAAGK